VAGKEQLEIPALLLTFLIPLLVTSDLWQEKNSKDSLPIFSLPSSHS
jgi:hypothetical protein